MPLQVTVENPRARVVSDVTTRDFVSDRHITHSIRAEARLPYHSPTLRRQACGIAVWGIPKIKHPSWRICNSFVRKRTVTRTQNPEFMAMKVQWMAHL